KDESNEYKQNSPLPYPQININLVEYTTAGYIQQFNLDTNDSAFAKEVLSVFKLQVIITESPTKALLNRDLDILIKQGPSNGIGIPIYNLPVTANGFAELLKKSLPIILDSTNHFELIEMKVAGAFVGDNFILENTAGLERTPVYSKDKLSKYSYNNQPQIIRWGNQEYREIILKGKNKTILNDSLQKGVEYARELFDADIVFLLQEGRDVLNDKNYLLQFPAQIAYNINDDGQAKPYINLITGKYHYLIEGKDTIAQFSVKRNIVETEKKLFAHQVTNGFTMSSITNIENTERIINMNYPFLVEGKLWNQPFKICISTGLREIYFNNQLICIAYGNKLPERFVSLGESINATTFNALMIIAYNQFLQ
ncbi:MAG: hypothetical protein Q8K64_06985, partial [Sediminibacterium sp.]|nr:hypothetical protein [Sediminibacterium sp.]